MSRPNEFYQDGYCHGMELPDDLWLDELVYPERPAPPDSPLMVLEPGMAYTDFLRMREEQDAAQRAANNKRDRDFAVTLDNVTGENCGPPRTAPTRR